MPEAIHVRAGDTLDTVTADLVGSRHRDTFLDQKFDYLIIICMCGQDDRCDVWSEFRELLIQENGRHLGREQRRGVGACSFLKASEFQTVQGSCAGQGSQIICHASLQDRPPPPLPPQKKLKKFKKKFNSNIIKHPPYKINWDRFLKY